MSWPSKISPAANFDYEGLQLEKDCSGGKEMHLDKQFYAPEAYLAFLVCHHIQNYAPNAFLALLMRREPQKYSCGASFDFECLHVEKNRSGGHEVHLHTQIYAPNAYLAILVCPHIQNYDPKVI